MNTETVTTTYTVEEKLHLIRIIKASLQALLAQYNLVGDQVSAFKCSKELCKLSAQEFLLDPHSRRTR